MHEAAFQRGTGQVVLLIAVAVVLALGYVAIDLYSGGQKDMAVVETRGVQMASAL